MSNRPHLSAGESTWAFVAGGGLILIILYFWLTALGGTGNANALGFVGLIGLVLLVGGTVSWLAQFRPWLVFDDMSTPLYTGHAHHDDHTPQTEHDAEAGTAHATMSYTEPPLPPPPVIIDPLSGFGAASSSANAELPLPPVMMDPMSAFPPVAPAPQIRSMPVQKAGHDDLQLLVGIGPKVTAALNGAGIFTFVDMTRRTPEELETVVRTGGVHHFSNANTWYEQARFAASGDMDALKQYQANLPPNQPKP